MIKKSRFALAVVILSNLMLSAVLTAVGQTLPEPSKTSDQEIRLETGKSLHQQIGGGETQIYELPLAANQFLSLTVKQYATDVSVKLIAPDEKPAAETDSTLGKSVIERLWFIAPTAGNYQVQIASGEKAGVNGSYEIKAELREADEKALKIIEAQKFSAEAFVLQEQRTTAGNLGAIEKYKTAVKLAQEAGDPSAELMPRVSLGVFYVFVGQPQLALENTLAAQTLAVALKDSAAEAQTLDNFVRIYTDSDPLKAIDYGNRAINLRNESGARLDSTTSLISITTAYTKIGKYDKAVETVNRALEIYRETGNESGETWALISLAGTYGLLGEHQKAIDTYQKPLAYLRRTKISIYEVTLLTNIGISYDILGEPQKAIQFYNEALTVARSTGNRVVESRTLLNLGVMNGKLGEFETALEYFTESLAIAREMKQSAETAAGLNNLGMLAFKLNDAAKALGYFTESLQIARQANNKLGESNTLYNLGKFYYQRGKFQEALTNYQHSLEIRRTLTNPLLQAQSLTAVGKTYDATGETAKAYENLNEARALVRTAAEPRQEAETLYVLADLERKDGKLDEALENIETSVKLIDSIRSRVAGQDLRTSYLAEYSDYYELRTSVLMDLHKARPNRNFAALALESAENAKARSLLELLNESRADIRQGVSPALLDRERLARQTLSAKANRQAQIFAAKNSTDEQKAAIRAEIEKLTAEYENIQAEIRAASPRYAALTQPVPLSVGELQKQILDPDTVLLEYSLGENHSYLWVAGQNSLAAYELPAREKIDAAARKVYELLTARNQTGKDETNAQMQSRVAQTAKTYEKAAADLSQIIVAPAAAQLSRKRLLIVADGALQYIPFGVLSIKTDKTYAPLAVSNEIVTLPSASTLAILRREKKSPAAANFNSLAVIADPVFDANDARLINIAGKPETASKNEQTSKVIRRSAEESGLMNFSRLRFSREEADNITQIAGALKPLEIVDFAANKDTVLSGKLSESGIVHFATHGLINSQNPQLSGVVLSLINQKGEAEDGFLRLFEIYNLHLNADLVVLSACQTALGREIKGEGLIGLTRGFMYAGAPRVVASLWSVDDRATAEFMRRFYQKLLKNKMRPAAALRAAQIEMRQTPRWREPYYWAAFTLQGEWK